MSAWLVSIEHINTLVSYALDHDVSLHPATDPEGVCRLLTTENVRSLKARYPGRDFLKDWVKESKKYRFERMAWQPKVSSVSEATQMIKVCDCFDYQACETDDYKETPTAAFVERVRQKAVSLGGLSEGKLYNEMKWGL